jgi:hypothetical protein
VTVSFLAPRVLERTLPYQKYYLLGLEQRTAVKVRGAPFLAAFPRIRPMMAAEYRLSKLPLLKRLPELGRGAPLGPGEDGFVGCYELAADGGPVRFAIDAHDAKEIRNPAALEWADIYFKANRWHTLEYDPKVRPVVNGNGVLDATSLAFLRSLRTARKDVDLVFVANVWGGREHVVRVFEQLAAVDCSKILVAILAAPGYDDEETRMFERRLRAAGVETRHSYLPPRELWQILARGRILCLRAGKHLCISWRMLDQLAMGAAILYDSCPPPRWPVPLEEGVHYEDCGIVRPPDTSAAPETEYEKVPVAVGRLLERPDHLPALQDAAARYFDEHAAPERVADYLLAEVGRYAAQRG